MGGGGWYYVPKVWSPTGGWWNAPKSWQRNTAVGFVAIGFVAANIVAISMKKERRPLKPYKYTQDE